MRCLFPLLAFLLALCGTVQIDTVPRASTEISAQVSVSVGFSHALAAEKMCIIGDGGQSNGTGFGERPGPNVPNTVWLYSSSLPNKWEVANDHGPGAGSVRPAFGSEFYNLTGIRVLFVKNTVNGGFQTDAGNSVSSGTPDKSWDVLGTATPAMIVELKAAEAWAIAAGFDAKQCGLRWTQGEADSNGIVWNSTVVTKQIFKNAFNTMGGRFRAEFGSSYPIYIFKIGALSNAVLALPANAGLDGGYAEVRAAHEEVSVEGPHNAAGVPLNFIASRMALAGQARNQLIDPNTVGVHWNQDLNDSMGRDAARRIVASGLWNRW